MNPTRIEWTQNPDGTQGYTFNPITGCLNHVNGMCKGGGFPCYAYRLANGRLKQRYLANENWAPLSYYTDIDKENENHPRVNPFYPRWWPERLYDVPDMEHAKPKGVFVCNMGELFGDWIPEEWVKLIMTRIGFWCKQHRFYFLTKQPQNLPKWSPFPDNCWVGVTATDIEMTDTALNVLVYKVDATVKYLSFEPLLGPMGNSLDGFLDSNGGINWLIIGACTGTLNNLKHTAMIHPELSLVPYGKHWTLQPKIEWVQEIVEAADRAGVVVFLKDNLNPLFESLDAYALGLPNWACDGMGNLRQEMPK